MRHVKRGKKRIKREINQLITPELEKDTKGNKANDSTMNCPFDALIYIYIGYARNKLSTRKPLRTK